MAAHGPASRAGAQTHRSPDGRRLPAGVRRCRRDPDRDRGRNGWARGRRAVRWGPGAGSRPPGYLRSEAPSVFPARGRPASSRPEVAAQLPAPAAPAPVVRRASSASHGALGLGRTPRLPLVRAPPPPTPTLTPLVRAPPPRHASWGTQRRGERQCSPLTAGKFPGTETSAGKPGLRERPRRLVEQPSGGARAAEGGWAVGRRLCLAGQTEMTRPAGCTLRL